MARSLDAPFKREFTITETGILGPGDIYVGDIKTLYISMNPTSSAKGVIQGKIGRDGKYFDVPFTITEGRSGALDISEVEYIRFVASVVTGQTDLNLFGYYDVIDNKQVTVTYNQDEMDRNILKVSLLEDIKEELQKLNFHMSMITGEDLDE